MNTEREQQHRKLCRIKEEMEDTHELQTKINQIGDAYPTSAAALTFGKEQRGTLQNSPRGGPILPADQKKRSNTLKTVQKTEKLLYI